MYNNHMNSIILLTVLLEQQVERERSEKLARHRLVQPARTQALFRQGVAVVGRFLVSGGEVLQQFAGLSNPRVSANSARKNHLQGRG